MNNFSLTSIAFSQPGFITFTLEETAAFQTSEFGWDIESAINFANNEIFAVSNMHPAWFGFFFCLSETTEENAEDISGKS